MANWRFAIVWVCILMHVSACGFHLRRRLTLAQTVAAVEVQTNNSHSQLVKQLHAQLRASGVALTVPDGVPADDNSVLQLNVMSERWGDLPIAIDNVGRAQEYSLRYAAIFTVTNRQGTLLVPQQVIELSHDYVSPPMDATGTSTEREILADELRQEMSSAILRRMDGVMRGRHDAVNHRQSPTQATSASEAPPRSPATRPTNQESSPISPMTTHGPDASQYP